MVSDADVQSGHGHFEEATSESSRDCTVAEKNFNVAIMSVRNIQQTSKSFNIILFFNDKM